MSQQAVQSNEGTVSQDGSIFGLLWKVDFCISADRLPLLLRLQQLSQEVHGDRESAREIYQDFCTRGVSDVSGMHPRSATKDLGQQQAQEVEEDEEKCEKQPDG